MLLFRKKITLLIIFIIISLNIFAQREANIWYFGDFAGIDFNSGVPIPLKDGALSRWEGVATFSNHLGNLLFYTDGETVWNSQHKIMPNGEGLSGHPSSTESAIIVPYPLNDSLYYVFTVDREGETKGLCYSLVNIKLDNGFGDIAEKNQQLITPVSEKVTAIRHANKQDIWLITHGWKTDSFFVYLINETGLNLVPQIFEIGEKHADIGLHGNNAVGYLRIAPTGDKIALVLQVDKLVEIYDFNDATGEISNLITIPNTGISPYGIEFSPDAKKLYITSRYKLYQIDLEAGNETNIINSFTEIGSSNSSNFFGALQLATDGKIYLAHEFNNYLGVINNPSKNPSNCNFQLKGFYLGGRQSRLGLPNFIQTYFAPPDFTVENYCFGDSTEFTIEDLSNIDSVVWDFVDPASGIYNSSKRFNPKHLFSAAEFYNVTLFMYRIGVEYKKNRIIKINSIPKKLLGNDTVICLNDTVQLNVYQDNMSYLWSNNSTDSIISAYENNEYRVNIKNIYTQCVNSDTINISLALLPDFSLGNDTSFCLNDSLKLSIAYPNSTFLWNNNSTDTFVIAKDTGVYWLRVKNNFGCINYDTIMLSNYPLPQFNLGNDTILCENTLINLSIFETGEYLWNNNSTNHILTISDSGVYWLQFTDTLNCRNYDTIVISKKYKPPEFNLGADTLLCEGETMLLNPQISNVTYLWQDASIDTLFLIREEGKYWCRIANICGLSSDTINVKYKICGEIIIPNIITPNEDGINDYFRIKGIEDDAWFLKIYNRWGQLLFYSEDYQNDWQCDKHNAGVYYYILTNIKYEEKYSGFVHVYK